MSTIVQGLAALVAGWPKKASLKRTKLKRRLARSSVCGAPAPPARACASGDGRAASVDVDARAHRPYDSSRRTCSDASLVTSATAPTTVPSLLHRRSNLYRWRPELELSRLGGPPVPLRSALPQHSVPYSPSRLLVPSSVLRCLPSMPLTATTTIAAAVTTAVLQ